MSWLLVVLALYAAEPRTTTPPEGFVDLTQYIPGLRVDIRYHTADNFTGAPLPGYGVPGAWMHKDAAAALKRVHEGLAAQGLGLLIYDAYRPLRGTLAMVAWAERSGNEALLNGYIARRSGHNHGHTVDLTLAALDTGAPLDMGTPWDTLNQAAHTLNAKGKVLERRLLLKRAMEAQGFKGYHKEWWHFGMPLKGTRARDVPYGCFEAPEGKWRPPAGWNQPGFVLPTPPPPTPCR